MADTAPPIPGPTTDKPPRRQRWIPVSLRTFAAILLLLGIGGGLRIGVSAYRQDSAIRHLRKLGIAIQPEGRHLHAEWIRQWVSESLWESLGTVQSVDLSRRNISDADLAHLKHLNGLEWLALNGNPITDDGMKQLNEISGLRALRLEQTLITDAGLANLYGLRRLEVLSVKQTKVTGSGLANLKGLTRLRFLDLEGTRINDTALADLNDLRGITELRLGGTQVSDAGLAELQRRSPTLRLEL